MQGVPISVLAGIGPMNVMTDHMITSTGAGLSSRNSFGCLIIALHDASNGNAAMAHISPGTPTTPAIAAMAQFLVTRGGTAANLGVLLVGGAKFDPPRHAELLNALTTPGLNVNAVRDHRCLGPNEVVIGGHQPRWKQVVLDPTTGYIAEIPTLNPINEVNSAPGLTVYTLSADAGVPTPVAATVAPTSEGCVLF